MRNCKNLLTYLMADPVTINYTTYLLRKAGPFLILVVGLLLFNTRGFSQEIPKDTIKLDTTIGPKLVIPEPEHSPKRASIYSAVLPGLGQIYNRQYWKAPIFWAGIGISSFYLAENLQQFKTFKRVYVLRTDNNPNNDPIDYAQYSDNGLKEGVEYYRRYRDLSYAAVGLFYLLNIVEASVGAHLFYFDVDEDVSLTIQPYQFQSAQPAYGLRLTLNF